MLAVPDLHFPWANQKSLDRLYDVIAEKKPEVVVQLGDLLDQFSHAKFARSYDVIRPDEEVKEGRAAAEAFWKNVRKAAGSKVRMFQLLGNHDARIMKRVYDKYPELASLVDLSKLYRFPNVETMDSERSELQIDGVYYIHGWLTRLGAHCLYYDAPVIHGHTHRAGIFYLPRRNRLIYEMDCGFLGDEKARPLAYCPTLSTRWILSCGWKDDYGPSVIPL